MCVTHHRNVTYNEHGWPVVALPSAVLVSETAHELRHLSTLLRHVIKQTNRALATSSEVIMLIN